MLLQLLVKNSFGFIIFLKILLLKWKLIKKMEKLKK
jgi:hypothetical protein